MTRKQIEKKKNHSNEKASNSDAEIGYYEKKRFLKSSPDK